MNSLLGCFANKLPNDKNVELSVNIEKQEIRCTNWNIITNTESSLSAFTFAHASAFVCTNFSFTCGVSGFERRRSRHQTGFIMKIQH